MKVKLGVVVGDMNNTVIDANIIKREDGFGKDLKIDISSRIDCGYYQTIVVNNVTSKDVDKIKNLFETLLSEF